MKRDFDKPWTDTTFTSGRLALYSSSQSDVLFSSIDFTPIPEPSTALLMGLGLAALGVRMRVFGNAAVDHPA
jgi:hypothetical protein